MTIYIIPIVEGDTEVHCVERLFIRIWNEIICCPHRLQVLQPIKVQRDRFLSKKSDLLEQQVQAAACVLKSKMKSDRLSTGCILVLLDAEHDGCPVEISRDILHRSQDAQSDMEIRCVIAQRMLENWIVAGARTLSNVPDFPKNVQVPDNIDSLNGAEWLEQQLRSIKPNRKYKKTVDAKRLINAFSIEDCRAKSRSFQKLVKELQACIPPEASSSDETNDDSSES